jgi:hypothetical protein
LSTVPGERATSPVNQDYIIKGLDQLLKAPTEELAKLVWRTMRRLPKLYLQARYQLNARHGSRYASSQLVHVLRQSAWVPQKNGQFVRPPEASRNQLPKGFPFDEGDEWLKAVRFGEEDRLRSEEHKKRQATAKELGFGDEETLADAQWFAALAPEERRRFKSEIEHRRQFELPENFPRNSEHRAERVGQQAAGAPERITEKRARSVSLGREEVKQAAKQYLRHQYTNTNGEMICQVCKGKVPLPFKLNDGSYHFETVEFLTGLKKRHHQNYLALCPNHRAMFKYANESANLIKDMFLALEENELEVILAQQSTTIYFTQTHILDLRKVIEVDEISDESAENTEEVVPA